MKIDVEGHELEVLDGARSMLESFSPVLILEVNDVDGLDRTLKQLGYQAFDLSVDNRTIRPTTVGSHAKGNVLAARDPAAVADRLR